MAAARSRIYLVAGDHIDVAETQAQVVAACSVVPLGPTVWNGILGPFTFSSGVKVYVNMATVTRVEVLP